MTAPRKPARAASRRHGFDPRSLAELLEAHRRGEVATADAVAQLRRLPFADLGFARVDHHRHLRRGQPEVIYGPGKTQPQISAIVAEMRRAGSAVMVTRVGPEVHRALRRRHRAARYYELARVVSVRDGEPEVSGQGTILVVSAGTSDLPVAEEAAVVAELLGNRVERLLDVGVAGIHRLLAETERLDRARVVIVVAGMEGALPSVVGGLTRVPVIAVPTSTGYGASFGGLAALLGMLNSCASGVTVVNIDNGFGAAAAASLANHL